ncbi:protein transport protein Sec24A isoform X1 [Periophthalmus magnuspinnatus]|uniref:protein transport protein Sec24A isoform X1 n=1 Tax=Periophthalmus magnuspinnatus TaxID=409849 RepID=UPI0024370AA1|nr:protein transport protein Sec24A isoform X1 [Periophthalmus magnuspinnatus]
MSTAGFNSQNGTGAGQPYANGPSQNLQQLPGVNYGMAPLQNYNQLQAKAPMGPGLYPPSAPSAPYQSHPPQTHPPVSSYQPLMPRPPLGGGSLPHTPPLSASPVPRMPSAQSTPPPPPVSSSGYYASPHQTPSMGQPWQYNATPTNPPAPMTPPHGQPATNHMPPPMSMVPPTSAYSAPPPTHTATLPPGPALPPTSLHAYNQPGVAPPPVTPMAPHTYQPGRPPYGAPPSGAPPMGPPPPMGHPPSMKPTPPPTGPPMGNATPPPPKADAQWDGVNHIAPPSESEEGDVECPGTVAGNGPQAPNSYNHVENKTSGAAQPGPPGRHLGHYPSLPPGYQSSPPGHTAQPYPLKQQPYQQPGPAQLSPSLAAMSLQSGTPEALRVVNLLQERNLLPPGPLIPPTPCLPQDLQRVNCNPEVFRCTLTSIPQTQSLLNKAKLPLGLLLHPFKDLSQLPVVTSSTIVRCRSCRTYINPFVSFLDQRRWKCNLCYRVNEVPEEFMYNPVSRAYGEPHKRPEVQNATIEFIAPSEYMLRPPQPAVYLFVLDVSHNAVETGYLHVFCQSLLDNLNSLPGDSRTKVGFITFDSTIHFYNLQEGLSQPQMLIVSDIEDIFLPTPDSLLVNLNESKELVQDLLKSLPTLFEKTMETQSALGSALQAAFKLLSPTGGRMSVFQTQLPNLGAGALQSREDPNQRAAAKDVQHLSPATDFYKKLALDCSGQQVAVDLFLLSAQYCDLASLGCISRYSAGSVYYYPSYHQQHNIAQVERFQKDLKRYLTRKIGFEAVMRIRCTKGLSIHTFHGNFFVRSTDLLSLPNVNPDAGFAVQMSIDENLDDLQLVSFQAALLYTSSKGERRIRVHTLCLPVVNSLSDVFAGADVQAISGLLACMAVDRSVTASLSDARDALTNAAIDSLLCYRQSVLTIQQPGLLAPACLRLFPLYVLALHKQKAFRVGTSTRLDDRVFAMCQLKYQPLVYAMLMIHPALYRVDDLTDEGALNINDRTIPQPRVLQLSVEKLCREGAFLMDAGTVMYLWIGRNCNPAFLTQVLGVPSYAAVPENLYLLPELDTAESQRVRAFVGWLKDQRPFAPTLHIIRDESQLKTSFLQNMIEDRTESALSYYEFLLHLQQQISK